MDEISRQTCIHLLIFLDLFSLICNLCEDGVSLQQHRNNLCRRIRNLKRKKQKLATNTDDDGNNTDAKEDQDNDGEHESGDSDDEGEAAANSLLGLNKKRPAKK